MKISSKEGILQYCVRDQKHETLSGKNYLIPI